MTTLERRRALSSVPIGAAGAYIVWAHHYVSALAARPMSVLNGETNSQLLGGIVREYAVIFTVPAVSFACAVIVFHLFRSSAPGRLRAGRVLARRDAR
jgi:hypothetical protein